MSNLSPWRSHQLLLRVALGPAAEASTRWDEWKSLGGDLEAIAGREHALLPVIAATFANHQIDVPERARLQGIYRRTWYRNRLLAAEAAAAIGVLAGASIPAMLLKGAALLAAPGSDYGALHMGDVDLLVPREHAHAAFRLLRAEGWRPTREYRSNFSAGFRYEHGVALQRKPGLALDLHWAAVPIDRGPGPDDGLWARSRPVDFAGLAVRVPSTEETLLLVVANRLRDRRMNPRWVADAVQIIAGDSAFDWKRFDQVAAERRLRAAIAPSLRYLANDFGVAIPASLIESMFGAGDTTLAQRLQRTGISGRTMLRRRTATLASRYAQAAQSWPAWRRPLEIGGFLRHALHVKRRRELPRALWRWLSGGQEKAAARGRR